MFMKSNEDFIGKSLVTKWLETPVRCRDWSASSSGMGDGVKPHETLSGRDARKNIAAQSEVAYRLARSNDTNSKKHWSMIGKGPKQEVWRWNGR